MQDVLEGHVEQCERTVVFFFFQAEDGIRDLVRSRGLGDVYKRQFVNIEHPLAVQVLLPRFQGRFHHPYPMQFPAQQVLSLIHI